MKKMMSTFASLVLSLFFAGIAFFLMFAVLEIQDSESGTAAIVFSSISLLVLIVVIGFGKSIAASVGAMYPAMIISTIVYTVINLVLNFALCDMDSSLLFILINLIMTFVYLCVVIPLAVFGANGDSNSDNSVNEIKEHNIRR